MTMEYILNAILLVIIFACFATGITVAIYTYKMRSQRIHAPAILRITGLSQYMSRYLTPEGRKYRNKVLLLTLVSIVLIFSGLFIGIAMDADGWQEVKEAYKDLPDKTSNNEFLKSMHLDAP